MSSPCTLITLDIRTLDEAVKTPALAALLDQGWEVAASVTVVPPGGVPELQLILSPPRPSDVEASGAWAHPVLVGLLVAQLVVMAMVTWGVLQ